MSVVEAKPLATYCVPGEQRSMDAIFYTEFISGGQVVVDSDIYYATHGTHLDALYLGTLLGSLDGCSTYLTCMQRCESIKGCITFRWVLPSYPWPLPLILLSLPLFFNLRHLDLYRL